MTTNKGPRHNYPWTKEDDDFIISNDDKMSIKDLSKVLGRTYAATFARRKILIAAGVLKYKNRAFSSEEDFYIRLSGETLKEIGEKLGRDWRSIAQRRMQLGIAVKYKKGNQ
jgi:hypothetical protein